MASRIKEAAQEFEAVCARYIEFGACDTEPRGEFFDLLRKTADSFEGYEALPQVPTGIRGWQLYSGMPGAGQAAREITRAARKAFTAAKRDRHALARYMNEVYY